MKTTKRILMGLLTLLMLAGVLPVLAAEGSGGPVIGGFANGIYNNPKDRYGITNNSSGQTVISYSERTNWDMFSANVSGYTAEYTRLCITAAFNGTQQFGVEVTIPGNKNEVIRYADLALTNLATRNADGSYTFDIPLSNNIRANGVSSIMMYLDPTVSFSGARSMTIIDIGFRKDGEPAGPSAPQPTQTYGISLSQTDTYTFPGATTGYSAQPANSVTVTNTGNAATGSLTVALSGTNRNSFTLSRTSLTSIAAGNSDSFTVAPNTGLLAGTYTATVTVSNNNVPAQTFNVTFTVSNPAPVYSISLSQTGTYTFPGATTGYGAQTPASVTVTNTGNAATGSLTVALSGTNRNSFTLSRTSLSSIAAGNSASFTVTPNTGLAAGTYTATVTVSNNNVPAQTFNVTFTVSNPAPVYSISLSQTGTYTFPGATTGYGAQTPASVTVTNTGNAATGSLTVALSGTNRTAFTLSSSSINSIVAGGSGSFTVAPNTGLAAGTYTATVTVSNTNVTAQTFNVTFTVSSPAPVYSISLSQTGTYTFPGATTGYGAQSPNSVTVTNTGNTATGSLTVALSGTNRNSFTLSRTSLSSIAAGNSGSFTVAPNTGLAAGTYTATVTVSNNNVTAQTFNVTFTVSSPAPVYSISLSQTGTYTFPGATTGYGAQTPASVTVTNTGNAATGSLTVALSGTNRNSFTLSRTSLSSIAAGNSGSFTVAPNTGLAAGTYTATVTVSNTNVTAQTFNVTFTVSGVQQYAVTVNGSYASTTGAGSYMQGATVTISAGTRTGYTFSGWTASATGVTFASASAATTTFVMPAANVTVTANWTATGTPAPANTFYVAKSGSNTTGDGSLAKPWGTIQNGIGRLKPGDTLIIGEGTYNEKLTVGVSGTAGNYITIKGEPGKRVVLDGTGVNGNNMIYLNNRNFVRIENLEICNNTYNVSGTNTGIYMWVSSGSTGIQLVNNKIYNIDGERVPRDKNGHGIGVYGASTSENSAVKDLLIEGNEIYNCKLGQSEAVVVNGNVTNWQIINNYIHDNDNIGIDAIGGESSISTGQLNRARNGLISGNVVKNNNGTSNPTYSGNGGADGIYVDGARDIVIENNYVTGSAYGVEIATENNTDYRPTGITIRNNVVTINDNAGILLGGTNGAGDVLLANNTVRQTAGVAIDIQNGAGPYTIRNNIIFTARNIGYVRGSAGSPTYTNNIYYGGATARPTGDANGQVVTTLPVVSNLTQPIAQYQSSGATLTTATTPFLSQVI